MAVVLHALLGAGNERHARLLHVLARARLGAHHLHRLRRRPNELDARLAAGRGKPRVLRQKAVAGMDRFRPAASRHVENLVEVEIRLAGRRRTDVVGVVGLAHVQGAAVHVGEHGDRFDAHLAAGADDADGDFTAVGDKNSFEHKSAFGAIAHLRNASDHPRHATAVAPKQALYCMDSHHSVTVSQTPASESDRTQPTHAVGYYRSSAGREMVREAGAAEKANALPAKGGR